MGMFDYLRCKYPLPVDGANDLLFQTKDTTAMWLDLYEIREDGTLWYEEHDFEDRSDPRWVPVPMTGEIRFYTHMDQERNEGWVEFSAYFVNGQLRELQHIRSEEGKEIRPCHEI